MSRRTSDENGLFVVLMLLAAVAWAHKTFMVKLEHYVLLIWLIGGAVFVSFLIYKFFKKLSRWSRLRYTPDISNVDGMTGLEFEHYVAKLLGPQGYEAIRLTEEYDYGVDIIAFKDDITWGIQVKRYSGLVKASAVRQVVTALRKYHCDRAMIITNSYFSHVAKELSRSNDCILIDRDKLIAWVLSR